MPRRRRVAKVRDGGLRVTQSPPNDKWEELMTGSGFGDGTGFENEAAKRAAWEANREALLIAWRERQGPGARPDAWWEYECPKTIQGAIPHNVRHHVMDVRLGTRGGFQGKRAEYLTLMRQFGLLTPEERKALGV